MGDKLEIIDCMYNNLLKIPQHNSLRKPQNIQLSEITNKSSLKYKHKLG